MRKALAVADKEDLAMTHPTTVALLVAGALFLAPHTAPAAQSTSLDRCISAIANDVARFTEKTEACLRKCEDGRRSGALSSDVKCRKPSNDPATQACLLRASEQITGSKSLALKRCVDDEVALFYENSGTCPGKNGSVNDILQCLAKKAERFVEKTSKSIYKPERAPAQFCGDGQITGSESCDPNAFPTGCFFNETCHAQGCFCITQYCGNGYIDPGEDCDYNAWPDGCSFTQSCGFNCSCSGSATAAFLQDSSSLLE
jgi:hypothetical protein